MTPLALVLVQKHPAAAELSLGSPMLGLSGYRLALGVRLRIPKVPVLLCSTPRPALRRLPFAYDVNDGETELPLHFAWKIET